MPEIPCTFVGSVILFIGTPVGAFSFDRIQTMQPLGNQFISEIHRKKARERTAKWRQQNPHKVVDHNKKFTRQRAKQERKNYTELELVKVRKRFMKKVELSACGCWLWLASKAPSGYGWFSYQGQALAAHVVSYWLFKGKTQSKHVLHKCDTPQCVNPDHLRLGTPADNADDRERKGRGRYKTVRL